MNPSLFARLALHPALLFVLLILPLVMLSAIARRIRRGEDEEEDEYVLVCPQKQ